MGSSTTVCKEATHTPPSPGMIDDNAVLPTYESLCPAYEAKSCNGQRPTGFLRYWLSSLTRSYEAPSQPESTDGATPFLEDSESHLIFHPNSLEHRREHPPSPCLADQKIFDIDASASEIDVTPDFWYYLRLLGRRDNICGRYQDKDDMALQYLEVEGGLSYLRKARANKQG